VTTAVPPFEHPLGHVLVVLALSWLTAGLLRDLLAAREEIRLLSPAALRAKTPRFSLGPAEVGIALGALNALFLAFVLVQLRYLFGGKGLVEAQAHLTYAQYARHGFFELLAVSALVLLVLAGGAWIAGAGAMLRRASGISAVPSVSRSVVVSSNMSIGFLITRRSPVASCAGGRCSTSTCYRNQTRAASFDQRSLRAGVRYWGSLPLWLHPTRRGT